MYRQGTIDSKLSSGLPTEMTNKEKGRNTENRTNR